MSAPITKMFRRRMLSAPSKHRPAPADAAADRTHRPRARAPALRSAARSLAERARGLRAISSASAMTGRLVSTRKVGAGRLTFGRVARAGAGFAAAGKERLDDAVLERMERHRHQPALRLEDALGGLQRRDQFAQFVVDENAQGLKRARGRMDIAGRERTTEATMSASAAVVRIGAAPRALTMARATAREWRSSPRMKMMLARSRSPAAATTSAALGALARPCACRAARRGGRKSRARRVSSCMEETPRSSTTPSTASKPAVARDRVEIGKAVFDQRQAAVRRLHQVGAERDRALVAVDADHFAVGGGEDGAACSRRRRKWRRYRRRRHAR